MILDRDRTIEPLSACRAPLPAPHTSHILTRQPAGRRGGLRARRQGGRGAHTVSETLLFARALYGKASQGVLRRVPGAMHVTARRPSLTPRCDRPAGEPLRGAVEAQTYIWHMPLLQWCDWQSPSLPHGVPFAQVGAHVGAWQVPAVHTCEPQSLLAPQC
jgi:hypothetical protein